MFQERIYKLFKGFYMASSYIDEIPVINKHYYIDHLKDIEFSYRNLKKRGQK